MKNKSTPLKISLHGMNDKMQKLILHCLKTLQANIKTLVVEEEDAEVEIIDVDLSAATNLAHRLAQDKTRPIIVLSLYENLSSDILYVKKPLHSSDLLAALIKAQKILLQGAKVLKRNQLMAEKKTAMQAEQGQVAEQVAKKVEQVEEIKPVEEFVSPSSPEVTAKPKAKPPNRANILKLIALKAAENIDTELKSETPLLEANINNVPDTDIAVKEGVKEFVSPPKSESTPKNLVSEVRYPASPSFFEKTKQAAKVVKFPSTLAETANKKEPTESVAIDDARNVEQALETSLNATQELAYPDLLGTEKLTEAIVLTPAEIEPTESVAIDDAQNVEQALETSLNATQELAHPDLLGAEKLTEAIVFDLFELDDDVTDEIDDDLKSLDHDDDAQSLDDLKNLYNAPVTEEAEFEDFDDFFADLGIGEPDNSEKKT